MIEVGQIRLVISVASQGAPLVQGDTPVQNSLRWLLDLEVPLQKSSRSRLAVSPRSGATFRMLNILQGPTSMPATAAFHQPHCVYLRGAQSQLTLFTGTEVSAVSPAPVSVALPASTAGHPVAAASPAAPAATVPVSVAVGLGAV